MTDPLYDRSCIQIYNGKAENVTKTLHAKPDLIITDPPYKQSRSGGGMNKKRASRKKIADNLSDFDPKWITEYVEYIGHAYIFCGKAHLSHWIMFCEKAGWGWNVLIYGKNNPIPMKNNTYLSDCEYIMFMRQPGECTWNNDAPFDHYRKIKMVNCKKSQYGHPTEKNIGIIRQLIRVSSNPGDLIIDPYLGSGTTLEACKAMGRRAVGIEIKKEYCEIAIKRLRQDCLFQEGVK